MLFYLIAAFLLGYIFCRFQRPLTIPVEVVTKILNSVAMFRNLIVHGAAPTTLSHINSNKKSAIISTIFGHQNQIYDFNIRILKTNLDILIKGISKNFTHDKNTELRRRKSEDIIEIHHYENCYIGLDISPESLDYEKLIVSVESPLGNIPKKEYEITGDTSVYDFLVKNTNLLNKNESHDTSDTAEDQE